MNYSFLIELCHVLIVPLSKETKREPIGSNTENCIEVMLLLVVLDIFSSLPIENFGLPVLSSLNDPI